MDCHKADGLMMKYMDSILNEDEAKALGEHIESCAKCNADFHMYDSIMTGFSEIEMLTAPEGFQECVMSRVMELPALNVRLNSSVENMMCLIWGALSVMFGLGFMAAINRNSIIEYFYSKPELEAFAGVLGLAEEYSVSFGNSMALVFNRLIEATSGYVAASRFILLGVLAVLAAVQYVVYQRNKVKV